MAAQGEVHVPLHTTTWEIDRAEGEYVSHLKETPYGGAGVADHRGPGRS